MKFTFLGTSAGVPTKKRNVTGLALSSGSDWCLVDCGEGTQQQLLHTPYSLASLKAVFITHVHGDHTYGLPGILASAGMGGRTAPLKVIAPKPLHEFIEVMLRTTDCFIPYPLELIDAEKLLNDSIDASGFNVQAIALSHRVPCFAYKFTELNVEHKLDQHKLAADGIARGEIWGKLHKGEMVNLDDGREINGRDYWSCENTARKLIVAGDNDKPDLLQQAVADVDLLIHESTYTQAVSDKVGPAPMHSSATQVAKFAAAMNLPNLVLTHFSARYGGSGENSIESIREEAMKFYKGPIFLAEDFASYQLKVGGELKLL